MTIPADCSKCSHILNSQDANISGIMEEQTDEF